MSNNSIAVYIGRFSPFHLGHLSVINEALLRSDYLCLAVGSALAPRSVRNPFTFIERCEMIRACFDDATNSRIVIVPIQDSIYNEQKWITDVQTAVKESTIRLGLSATANISLVGHRKDESTGFYLNMFPTWGSVAVPNFRNINATDIRRAYFSNIGEMWVHSQEDRIGDRERDHVIGGPVREWLKTFLLTDAYKMVCDEIEFIDKYRLQWKNVPYEVIFQTVDAVVVQAGHVLMIRRGAFPGKGLLALPGGFLNPRETLEDGMIRELFEETKIAVPEEILRANIVATKSFDDPNRSSRGRTITNAFMIHLPTPKPRIKQRGKPVPVAKLPKVVGSDDADKALWVPLSDINPEMIFEDHAHIINFLTANLDK